MGKQQKQKKHYSLERLQWLSALKKIAGLNSNNFACNSLADSGHSNNDTSKSMVRSQVEVSFITDLSSQVNMKPVISVITVVEFLGVLNESQPLKMILNFENSQFLTALTQKVLEGIKNPLNMLNGIYKSIEFCLTLYEIPQLSPC